VDFDFDPRDLERDETRDVDMPWIELGRGPGSAREEDDPRDRDLDAFIRACSVDTQSVSASDGASSAGELSV